MASDSTDNNVVDGTTERSNHDTSREIPGARRAAELDTRIDEGTTPLAVPSGEVVALEPSVVTAVTGGAITTITTINSPYETKETREEESSTTMQRYQPAPHLQMPLPSDDDDDSNDHDDNDSNDNDHNMTSRQLFPNVDSGDEQDDKDRKARNTSRKVMKTNDPHGPTFPAGPTALPIHNSDHSGSSSSRGGKRNSDRYKFWNFLSRRRRRRGGSSAGREAGSTAAAALTLTGGMRVKAGAETANTSGGLVSSDDVDLSHVSKCNRETSCEWYSYCTLLQDNRNYRLYLVSHLCQHAGDWFVHVASLIAIERLVPGSGTAISLLVATRMVPMILFTSFGGALADRFDRRVIMIILDAWNAAVALLYLVALHYRSASLLYAVSFLRHSVVAMYEPVTRSIVPLLVQEDADLKRAMTMNGMAWAVTLTFGGTLAGISAATLGVGACYLIDSSTYIASTLLMWLVSGKYSVIGGHHGMTVPLHPTAASPGVSMVPSMAGVGSATGLAPLMPRPRPNYLRKCIHFLFSPWKVFSNMFMELGGYLSTCQFGALVLLKATGNITWGTADIINVHIAHIEGNELATSTRIGLIYSSVGIGCLMGPICANFFTNMSRPSSIQWVCVAALGFVVIGWVGMGSAEDIMTLCISNSIRAFGSSIVWINSTLLLQKLTSSDMLGRVLSFDFSITMLCDTTFAFVAGTHEDAGVDTEHIALAAAMLVACLWVCWSLYHSGGKGAARKVFNVGNMISPSVSLHKEMERLDQDG